MLIFFIILWILVALPFALVAFLLLLWDASLDTIFNFLKINIPPLAFLLTVLVIFLAHRISGKNSTAPYINGTVPPSFLYCLAAAMLLFFYAWFNFFFCLLSLLIPFIRTFCFYLCVCIYFYQLALLYDRRIDIINRLFCLFYALRTLINHYVSLPERERRLFFKRLDTAVHFDRRATELAGLFPDRLHEIGTPAYNKTFEQFESYIPFIQMLFTYCKYINEEQRHAIICLVLYKVRRTFDDSFTEPPFNKTDPSFFNNLVFIFFLDLLIRFVAVHILLSRYK